MNNKTYKLNFLIKSFIAGIIGSTALYFYWDIGNEVVDRILTNFHWHFGGVVIFWLWLGNDLRIKGWLMTGFVGSLIYSFAIVLTADMVSPIIGNQTYTESLLAIMIVVLISMT